MRRLVKLLGIVLLPPLIICGGLYWLDARTYDSSWDPNCKFKRCKYQTSQGKPR